MKPLPIIAAAALLILVVIAVVLFFLVGGSDPVEESDLSEPGATEQAVRDSRETTTPSLPVETPTPGQDTGRGVASRPPQPAELDELPWEADGLTDIEQVVQGSLQEISKTAPGTAVRLADLPWMADEVTLEERIAVPAIEKIAASDRGVSRAIVDLPWVGDDVEGEEIIALELLVVIAEEDPAIALALAESPILSDEVTLEAQFTLLTIGYITREDPALAREIAESPQIADGISGNELGAFTGSADYYLERLRRESPTVADILKDYPWASSDTSRSQTGPRGGLLARPAFQVSNTPEELAKALLYFFAQRDPTLAEQVASLAWLADGVTAQEARVLANLDRLASRDLPLAGTLLGLPWLADEVTRREAWAISRVWHVLGSDETSADLLVNQPWFQDGLDGEDHARVTILRNGCNFASFCRQLIESGHVVSTTLSFPSGDVRVFGVSRSPLGSISDALFQNARDAIPPISEMMGHPWAWPEVIVYHEPELHYVSEIPEGFFQPNEPQYIGIKHAEGRYVLHHEMAHYYSFGPHWLVEGGADFLERYTQHVNTGLDLQQELHQLELQIPCNNAENIHQYVLATEWISASIRAAKFCSYTFGNHFLLALYLELGQEMVSGALADLYRLAISGDEITEDVIYQALLSNTPPGLEQRFRDLYQEIHGRPVGYQPPEATGDRAALIALYEATGGPSWTRNRYWLTDAPLGLWEGVQTSNHVPQQLAAIAGWQGEDRSGRVIGIFLTNNGLTGALPAELGNFAELRELHLPANNLTGAIPEELGELTNLESLWLNENQLTGPIPPELGNLSGLQQLILGSNELSGPIPAQLGRLMNLKQLALGRNQFSGEIPSELGNLIDLEQLMLFENQLTGQIPPELGNLVSLRGWGIGGNQFTGCVPDGVVALMDQTVFQAMGLPACGDGAAPTVEASDTSLAPGEIARGEGRAVLAALNDSLGGVPGWEEFIASDTPARQWTYVGTDRIGNITSLGLSGLGLTGTISPDLGKLTSLERLQLNNNQLTGPIPQEIGNLVNLKALRLHKNQLTGPIPEALGNLVNLEHLELQKNQLSGAIPPELGNLIKLELLRVEENQLSGVIPPELGSLAAVAEIGLQDNLLTGPIPLELGNLPNVFSIYLGDNQLTDPLPAELANAPTLQRLFIQGNNFTCVPAEYERIGNTTGLEGLPPC